MCDSACKIATSSSGTATENRMLLSVATTLMLGIKIRKGKR